ncbi:efflux RND transporter periplasmic adaptor subunit [Limimaricola hongkongensis]|uniref:Putative Co/Zn/Cd efflux system membrane fusion protein n=1 Tax=Limimaricola hongkongensis DSM 17492 TaxID=1122180 RepID=A0A017HAW6_9RHOB|nr:efflux RND transporter periplasmic adaptor subunit [Limimaricola hongkongensis]EYD71622.1 putative Co/Zn/Cd efflux system membrane fusion protein [Limimaricola hongkongensis DSM 17492]
MKLIPALTAILVAGFLYLLIVDRDRLYAIAQIEAEGAEDAAMTEQETEPGLGVVALRSAAREVDDAVVLRGRTEAARQVEVRAETSGRVVSEPLRKGAMVETGDALCRLDPGTREIQLAEAQARLVEAESRVPTAQAGKAEAEARLREAEINLNNARRLSQGGFQSETAVISAEAALEAATAQVQSAESSLVSARAGIEAAAAAVAAARTEIDRLTIRAPFDGLLETDTAELGLLMQTGAPCATIVQLDPIKLVGFVPEVDVDEIRVGARASGRLASGQALSGEVRFVSRSADPTTRTFRVEVMVPNPDLEIRDGQTAEILVDANGTQAHLLPQSALTLDDSGRLGVRIVEQRDAASLARFMPVELLRDTPEGVLVAGLAPETAVIVVGQEYVTDGVRVAPSFRETGQ